MKIQAKVDPQRPLEVPPMIPQPARPDVSPGAVIPVPVHVYMRERVTWQYKRIVRNLAKEEPLSEGELNELGSEHWELCGMVSDAPFVYFYLRRPA
jgi:hypothetical protein